MFDPYPSLQRPGSFRPAPRGYYVVKQLLIFGAITGSLVALYRNDVFRDLSRRAGQEHRYLAAEKFLVGTPGWGTPRSMEPVLAGKELAPPPAPDVEPAPIAEAPVAAPPPARPAAPPAPPPVAGAAAPNAAAALVPVPLSALEPVDPLKPVSLDSLPLAGASQKTLSLDESTATSRAPAPSRPAPAPNTRATKVSLDEPAAPAPKPVAAKPAPPPKPAEPERPKAIEARPNDNPLTAAIRGAVRARPPKDTVPQ